VSANVDQSEAMTAVPAGVALELSPSPDRTDLASDPRFEPRRQAIRLPAPRRPGVYFLRR